MAKYRSGKCLVQAVAMGVGTNPNASHQEVTELLFIHNGSDVNMGPHLKNENSAFYWMYNYIYLPLNDIADSLVDVSEEEILKRYEENKEESPKEETPKEEAPRR